MNGLLQTEDYARAIMSRETWRDAETIEDGVRVRMARQGVLNRRPPAGFTFFAHEDAFRRRLGDDAVMHEQMLHILLLTALDHLKLRIVPSDAEEFAAFGGPFKIFSFSNYRPLVYLDNFSGGLFLEDHDRVGVYRQLVTAIADVALDERESRELLAAMAGAYDRGSAPDADGREVEEEQLQ